MNTYVGRVAAGEEDGGGGRYVAGGVGSQLDAGQRPVRLRRHRRVDLLLNWQVDG